MKYTDFKEGDRVVYTDHQGDGPRAHKIGTTGVVDKMCGEYLNVRWDKGQRNNDDQPITGIHNLFTHRFELINKTDYYEIY